LNAPGTIQHLFLLPLTVQLTVLMFLGWFYRKRGYRQETKPKTNIFRCTSCKHVYIDTRRVPLSKCPKCNTLNPVIRR
jgi:predicted Zn-ribbon and HTH transcriptional regulator